MPSIDPVDADAVDAQEVDCMGIRKERVMGSECMERNAGKWFAVRCRPGREDTARQELERQGMEAYLPRELKLIRHARKMEKKPRPFFPGYLFLHLTPEERRWTAIRSTRGAIGAVHFGSFYPPVPEEVITSLKGLEDADGLVCQGEDSVSPFRPGERVVVNAGQFSGIEGIFLCRNGDERAMVLLEMLQRQVKAGLPLASLKAA